MAASYPDTSSAMISAAGRMAFIRPTIWPTGMAAVRGGEEDEVLAHRHGDGGGVLRGAHPLVRFGDENVLQGHGQRIRRTFGVPGVGPPALEQPGRLARVDATAHGVAGGGGQQRLLDDRWAAAGAEVVFGGGEERRAHPDPGGSQRQRRRDLAAGADAAGGKHGRIPHGINDFGHQDHGCDLTGVATCLVALGHHDVHPVVGVTPGVRCGAGQCRDRDTRAVSLGQHVRGR